MKLIYCRFIHAVYKHFISKNHEVVNFLKKKTTCTAVYFRCILLVLANIIDEKAKSSPIQDTVTLITSFILYGISMLKPIPY